MKTKTVLEEVLSSLCKSPEHNDKQEKTSTKVYILYDFFIQNRNIGVSEVTFYIQQSDIC